MAPRYEADHRLLRQLLIWCCHYGAAPAKLADASTIRRITGSSLSDAATMAPRPVGRSEHYEANHRQLRIWCSHYGAAPAKLADPSTMRRIIGSSSSDAATMAPRLSGG